MSSRSPGRLFVDGELTSDTRLTLPAEQSHYLARVLRLAVGDVLTLFDGRGGEFAATISTVAKSGVVVDIGARSGTERESKLAIRLVQGISRGERMNVVVQKATELGVARITPVMSEFSVVKLDRKRRDSRAQHWTRIARSACEQCGRNRVPVIDEPQPFSAWLAGTTGWQGSLRIVLEPSAPAAVGELEATPSAIELLIGPEGGLSAREVEEAKTAGFTACSLGPRILRTETAAIAAIAVLQARWGDLKRDGQR